MWSEHRRGARGGWSDPNWWGAGWWAGPGAGRHGHGRSRGGRMFEQGDLKYVILRLLSEKPRHGYEIIKAMEERLGGTYSPSPGAVYPTLQFLEDAGYAKTSVDEGGRKIYEITDEGRKYLDENKSSVDEIFDRIADFAGSFFGGPMVEVHHAFKNVARATYATATRQHDPEKLRKIREILNRATAEIEAISKPTSNV
jgi:DNA-binding PadR family transcriptional regulator